MPTFIAERYMPALADPTFEETAARAASAAAAMTDLGVPIRYLGSVYVPDEEWGLCCFEAHDASTVSEANRRAGARCWRVVQAVVIER